jgi:hypothetical protein
MRIVYHLGAHCTDEDRLVRCLLKNRAVLAEEGIIVPAPTRYRRLLRDTVVQLKGAHASAETQALILDQIMEETVAERMILCWDHFLGFPIWAVGETLYDRAGERIRAFTRVFPDIESEFHLALRNPAGFLPDLRRRLHAKGQTENFAEVDPFQLRWSDVVRHIRHYNPGVPITVWCDEDTPLIWPEVLQSVAGHAPETVLQDTDDILSQIMTEIGMNRMRGYCAEHPPQSVAQRRRIVTAFLEKFARPDQVESEVEMPNWDQETVDALNQHYAEDVEYVRQMAGVRFIEP